MIDKIINITSINSFFDNKGRKFIYCFIVIFLVAILFVVYVGIPVPYKLLHSQKTIESIQVVEVFVDGKKEYSYLVINDIEDIEIFIDELYQLKYRWHLNGPASIDFDTIAFRINYNNGEYEVLDYAGRYTYQIEKGIQTRGYGSFNLDEFNQLINKNKK